MKASFSDFRETGFGIQARPGRVARLEIEFLFPPPRAKVARQPVRAAQFDDGDVAVGPDKNLYLHRTFPGRISAFLLAAAQPHCVWGPGLNPVQTWRSFSISLTVRALRDGPDVVLIGMNRAKIDIIFFDVGCAPTEAFEMIEKLMRTVAHVLDGIDTIARRCDDIARHAHAPNRAGALRSVALGRQRAQGGTGDRGIIKHAGGLGVNLGQGRLFKALADCLTSSLAAGGRGSPSARVSGAGTTWRAATFSGQTVHWRGLCDLSYSGLSASPCR